MKYHILHDFRTSTPFKEKSSYHFKDFHKMELFFFLCYIFFVYVFLFFPLEVSFHLNFYYNHKI